MILNEKKKKIAGLNQELEIIKSTIKPGIIWDKIKYSLYLGTKIDGIGIITKARGDDIINTDVAPKIE